VDVEQHLADTQEMNVNLSIQLEKSLSSQKVSSATTTQIVKMIQADLGRVSITFFNRIKVAIKYLF
jgi:hypothetical protein